MDEQHLTMARAALDRGNGRRALEHLAEVADLDTPDPWEVRARALLLTDDAEAAVEAAGRGLQIEPMHHDLLLVLAAAEDAAHRPARAETALLAVLNQHPEHQQALFLYATLLLRSGDPVGAEGIVGRLDPDLQTTAPVLALRSRIASAQGKEHEAVSLAKLALHIDPESPHAHQLRAVHGMLQDRPDEVVAGGRRAAQADPEALGDLGRWSNYLGHPLMAPSRLIERIGPVQLWIGAVLFLFIGRRLVPGPLITVLTLAYLALVIYSWTVPFLLRRWLQWRGRL